MNYNNLTIGIVTFKSEKVIFNCLKSIKKFKNIIIFDNSNDKNLRIQIKKKFPHVKFILSNKNLGFGAGYNQIIKHTKSKYFFLISPDTILNSKCVKNLMIIAKKIRDDFSIIAPKSNEINYGFFNKKKGIQKLKNEILKVDYVKGFAMFFNLKKFKNKKIFDEKIFLYLEEIDLCRKIKKNNGKIFVVRNSYIKHLFAKSSNIGFEYVKCRNWHWMWSKFYYNKKYNGYFFGLLNTLPNFISAFFKYYFYLLIRNKYKKVIYKMRLLGLLASYMLKESYYRPYISKN